MTNRDLRTQPGWYALYTRHQHEKVVANTLSTKGFQVFLPLCEVVHQWKDREKHVSLPLFPCYVFLHTALDQGIEVLRTPGVYQFVGFGGAPSAIPVEEIAALQRTIGASVAVEPYPFLQSGDRVRVKHGALAGVEGILVRHKNQCRLVLSVEILQRSVAVEMEISKVERLVPEVDPPGLPSASNTMAFSRS